MAKHRVWYRVGQFTEALRATFEPVDETYVQRHLGHTEHSTDLLRLFRTMPRTEQHHGAKVCRVLEHHGDTDPDLFIAALLHDVGKTIAPPRLWERVLVVLAEHFAARQVEIYRRSPSTQESTDRNVPRGIRRPFVVRRHHAQWGAELAAEAGAPSRTAALIRHHHDPAGNEPQRRDGMDPEDVRLSPLLEALQAADET